MPSDIFEASFDIFSIYLKNFTPELALGICEAQAEIVCRTFGLNHWYQKQLHDPVEVR